jgi:hypothetical protein
MASGLRGAFGIVSLVLLAASVLFMIFVIISGVSNVTPLTKTYFLQADTSGIQGARPVSQWTFFYVCGEGNQNCGNAVPALPFGAAWIGGGQGAPADILGKHYHGTTSSYYYYMWRFGWVFYLISFFFNVFGFIGALVAPCSRLGSAFSGMLTFIALGFMSVAAPLMTAEFIKARNSFRAQGISAKIGVYAFAWTWAAWACMLIATIFLFVGCGVTSRSDSTTKTGGNTGFFRRQRSRRSGRGSLVDNESQRRVKDEYN